MPRSCWRCLLFILLRMGDILIAVGFLAFVGLLVYAFISAARKQRAKKSAAFRDLAQGKGFHYEPQDDGKAERFAKDLDGLGQFVSPSLGRLIPQDVVVGTLRGTDIVLFRHMTRFYEGYSREWFVAGIRARTDIAARCSVEFFENKVAVPSMYLKDPILKEKNVGPFHLVVRAPSLASAGKILDDKVLERLGNLACKVPFRPEIQVRETRVAVYVAERNTTIETVGHLEKLLDFSMSVAASCLSTIEEPS